MAHLTWKMPSMAASHFMQLWGRSNSCFQTVSNTHTYGCLCRNVVLNTHDYVPHMLSLCSCNRALSLKRSDWRIPEQVCKPNSATWTHWGLQAQATQSLCKYSVINIWSYTGGQIYSLASYLLPMNITVTVSVAGVELSLKYTSFNYPALF